jgi:hypothetical protein
MERVWDFTRRILEAGEQEGVMRVVESSSPWPFRLADGGTWLDSVRERFERTGEIRLFPAWAGPIDEAGRQMRTPARLAYFKGDDVVEEEVEDCGRLLRTLHHVEDYSGRYNTSPIHLSGYSRTGEDWIRNYPPDKLWISLGLYTDIWFPRVIGINIDDALGNKPDLVDPHPARGRDGYMDNSALAGRHTPRLNRFIQTLREAILELGGTWGFEQVETAKAYRSMVHDGGINLDHPVASA